MSRTTLNTSTPPKKPAEIQCDPGLDPVPEKEKKRKKKAAKKDVVGTMAKFEYGLLAITSISIVSLLNFVNLITVLCNLREYLCS